MKKPFLLFASLLMLFVNVNYANGEDFMSALQAFAQNVSGSTLKSMNIEFAQQKAPGSDYDIEYTVDKNGNFDNFKVITSTGNKEVDEHIIDTIKAQAHKYPLPAGMANFKQQIKLREIGHIQSSNKADYAFREYIDKVKAEVFKNPNAIISWVADSSSIKNGSYRIFVDKNGLFFDVKVVESTGDLKFDTKMINLIKSKSGVIPLPEKYTLGDNVFTLNVNLKQK